MHAHPRASFEPLAKDPISSPIPCRHSSLTYPSLFSLPRHHTKTSCESNKPLINHKALSGDRLGPLKMSGMLPRARSLPPTSPAPGISAEGLKSPIEDGGDVRAG